MFQFHARLDGRIVVESRADGRSEIDRMNFEASDTLSEDFPVGAEGCLVSKTYVGPNKYGMPHGTEMGVFLHDDPDGLPGNSNYRIKRLHGWRGTTNDFSVIAHGWRRVEESRPVTRGIGWRIVFGRDLKPDAD